MTEEEEAHYRALVDLAVVAGHPDERIASL